MIDRDSPVTEDELHAYVDGELPADRRGAVEAWLASHPDDAARVAAWRAQAEAIRARYGCGRRTSRCRRASTSPSSRAAHAPGARSPPRPCSRRSSSAASPAGWRTAHRRRRRAAIDIFTTEALERPQALHRRGAPPDRGAAAEQHLVPWLSQARRHQPAGAGPEGVSASSCSAAACCRDRSARRRCSCTRAERRALHDLLLALEEGAHRACAIGPAATSARCTGSRARSARSSAAQPTRPAREDRAGRLRADRKPAGARSRPASAATPAIVAQAARSRAVSRYQPMSLRGS